MARFADEFGYTPDEFRALTLPDYSTLCEYLEGRDKARRAQSKKRGRR